MHLIVLTGLPTKEKELLTHDLAAHYLGAGQRVAVLDNAGVAGGLADLEIQIVNLRGGCACCAVAGKLYGCADDVAASSDVAIMAADNQTHVDNLTAVLDNLVDGSRADITVTTVALVDDRTQCCFPYMAETLEMSTDITVHAPFSAAVILAALGESTP
jgi:hypothetical protein